MKTLKTFVVALIAFAVASCSSKPQLTHMPAKADGDSDWGLIDANGEFLVSDEFENRPEAVIDGIFSVEESNGITVYRAEKSLPIVGDLTELKDCGFYTEGLMPIVREGEHITFVDGDGNTKFVLDYVDGVQVKSAMKLFMNGLCTFLTVEGKCGAIDVNGNVVIEPVYGSFLPLEDYCAVKDIETDEYKIIDKKGNKVAGISGEIVEHTPVLNGFCCVEKVVDDDTRWAMVNVNGEETKLPSSVDEVVIWNDTHIVFENDGGDCGVMTFDGNIVIRAKYDHINILPNGKFLAHRGDKYMYVNLDGETEPLSGKTVPAIRDAYIFSKLFDFNFELIREYEEDDEVYLLSYTGEKIGKMLGKYRDRVKIGEVRSDYYDYESVTDAMLELFDSNGLKGYQFGLMIGNYADSAKSKSWYRGDYSISVTPENNSTYFNISSAKLNSNNTVVYDATPYASYYTWEFNPQARVNSATVTLSFYYDNYRNDLDEHFAEALSKKYGVNFGTEGNYTNYVTSDGYSNITIHVDESAISGTTTVVEVCDSAVVKVCDSVAMAPVDSVAW